MTKRTSECYVCTLDTNSVSDMNSLTAIRAAVKAANVGQHVRNKKRVVIRGRKPKVKMFVKKGYFTSASKGLVSYDNGGNIVGGIKNATIIDVYVYNVSF